MREPGTAAIGSQRQERFGAKALGIENRLIALPGHQFHVIALDGNPVPTQKSVEVLFLGPGERIDSITVTYGSYVNSLLLHTNLGNTLAYPPKPARCGERRLMPHGDGPPSHRAKNSITRSIASARAAGFVPVCACPSPSAVNAKPSTVWTGMFGWSKS